jgi:hypothetical protein
MGSTGHYIGEEVPRLSRTRIDVIPSGRNPRAVIGLTAADATKVAELLGMSHDGTRHHDLYTLIGRCIDSGYDLVVRSSLPPID